MNASEARNKHCMTFISMSSCQTKIVKMSTSYTDKSAIKLLHDENKCNGERTCKMLHAQHVALRVSSLYLTQQVRRISCIFRSCIFHPWHFVPHFQVLYFLVIHFQRPSSPTQKIARIAPSVSIAANSPSTSREFLDLMKKNIRCSRRNDFINHAI